jgi:hypothetical protein
MLASPRSSNTKTMTLPNNQYDRGLQQLPELKFELRLEQQLTLSQIEAGLSKCSRSELESQIKRVTTLYYIHRNQVADLLRHITSNHMASMIPSNLGAAPQPEPEQDPEPTEWKAKIQTEPYEVDFIPSDALLNL